MALYAFDGTWNIDQEEASKDSNVVRFRDVYQSSPENIEYLAGVGTNLATLGKIFGGVFGFGGRSRIEQMEDKLTENYKAGHKDIDIIGFSRGAALALHFANKLSKDGITVDGKKVIPEIRFLGLFDTVASFGIPFNIGLSFQTVNLGWDVDKVADNVDCCFHAMALDECRESFGLTRLNKDHSKSNITEVWFKGVHSDIGGSNGNRKLNDIAFQWMLDNAIKCGLPIKTNHEIFQNLQPDPTCPAYDNFDPFTDEDVTRNVGQNDIIHQSAIPKSLKVGEKHEFTVFARCKFNWSQIKLEKGAQYRISAQESDYWYDGGESADSKKTIQCNAKGWNSDDLHLIKDLEVTAVEKLRRHKDALWFELIGSYGNRDDKNLIRIGLSSEITAIKTAELYCFANDLPFMYGNNHEYITVSIERLR